MKELIQLQFSFAFLVFYCLYYISTICLDSQQCLQFHCASIWKRKMANKLNNSYGLQQSFWDKFSIQKWCGISKLGRPKDPSPGTNWISCVKGSPVRICLYHVKTSLENSWSGSHMPSMSLSLRAKKHGMTSRSLYHKSVLIFYRHDLSSSSGAEHFQENRTVHA